MVTCYTILFPTDLAESYVTSHNMHSEKAKHNKAFSDMYLFLRTSMLILSCLFLMNCNFKGHSTLPIMMVNHDAKSLINITI